MINIAFTTAANIYMPNIRTVGYGLSMLTTYLTLYFLNVKTWMIYYQYQWTYYALQLKWQMIINTNTMVNPMKKDINWFIRHRHGKWPFGKLDFVKKLFGCIHLLFAVVCCLSITVFIPYEKSRTVGIILLIIITLTTLIFYAVIVHKTPPFDDIYSIHRENKVIAPVLLIGLTIYIIFGIVEAYIFERDDNPNEELVMILGNVAQIEILLMWTLLLYISTIVIINNNVDTREDAHKQSIQVINLPNLQKNIISSKLKKVDLGTVLSDKDTIDQFMKYLSREFSMENLLSYIEFTQYMQNVKDSHEVNEEISEDINLIQFPENVPMSSIVGNQWVLSINDKLDNDKVRAHKIYDKYIKTGSEFEINVPWDVRKKCALKMDDLRTMTDNHTIRADDLFVVFNPCRDEVTKLLNNSLVRFKDETDHVNATAHAQIVVHPTDLSQQL